MTPPTPDVLDALAGLFAALADPTRLRLLAHLAGRREASVADLTAHLRGTQPAVSHHLNALRAAGLVDYRQAGRYNLYRLAGGAAARLRGHLPAGGLDLGGVRVRAADPPPG